MHEPARPVGGTARGGGGTANREGIKSHRSGLIMTIWLGSTHAVGVEEAWVGGCQATTAMPCCGHGNLPAHLLSRRLAAAVATFPSGAAGGCWVAESVAAPRQLTRGMLKLPEWHKRLDCALQALNCPPRQLCNKPNKPLTTYNTQTGELTRPAHALAT